MHTIPRRGRPAQKTLKPYIVERAPDAFQATLRGAYDRRIAVGTYATRELAMTACAEVMAGRPAPEGNPRGPKAKRRKCDVIMASPACGTDRLAQMRATLARIEARRAA